LGLLPWSDAKPVDREAIGSFKIVKASLNSEVTSAPKESEAMRKESVKPRILIVDGEENVIDQIRSAMEFDYEILTAETEEEATQIFAEKKPAVVTLELSLNKKNPDDVTGLRLLDHFLREAPSTRVIVITANKEESSALEAVRLGAFDYCSKPVPVDEINLIVRRAFHMQQLQQRLQESCLYVARPLGSRDRGFASPFPADINLKFAKKAIEADFIKKALSRNGGIVSRAARDLGISRVNLYELMDRYNIQIQEFKSGRSIERLNVKSMGGIIT
jgi:DNA-binding NtrC family response regulator